MAEESSRKTELATPSAPAGCPRCGTRLGQPYKYCPNCAYRLRPDLVPQPHVPVAGAPLSQRVIALGGYLLFASMLLMVVFAGVRLFVRPEPQDPVSPQVMRTRDSGCLALTLAEFVEVPAGVAFWGLYDPGGEAVVEPGAAAAGEGSREAEEAESALAELADLAAPPEEVDEARRVLKDALDRHPSVRDALRRWVDARDIAEPHDPVAGAPDPYQVENPFRMSKREVTNDQYFEFLRAWARKTGARVPRHLIPARWKRATGSHDVPKMYNDREGDFPVVGIPFDAALEFCGWFWEERLGADPGLVVDLPTWREFILAARGDELTYNCPWGRTLYEAEKVNLDSSGPWSVVEERKPGEFHNGFLDLVGNAAEWVYWTDNVVAAGWSFQDAWVYKVHEGQPGQPARIATPFSEVGFTHRGESWDDVGFRPVIRRAPEIPSFIPVTAGLVRRRPCPDGILPPERLDADEPGEGEGSWDERETIEQIRKRREPPITFAAETEQVARGFDISSTEITNRQYLAFLAATAPGSTKDEIEELLPKGWLRENLFSREHDRRPVPHAYEGYYLPPERLRTLYAAGQENLPVQGITIQQAEHYVTWLSGRLGRRCTIPTVAQYLWAARGDGASPYPWGDDPHDRELFPSYRPEAPFGRAFYLAPTLLRPIVGLAGNVAELVRDESGRLLLAGGFYDLPARLATLDCFLDETWVNVQYVIEPEDDLQEDVDSDPRDPLRPKLSAPRRIDYCTGIRVVRLPDPF